MSTCKDCWRSKQEARRLLKMKDPLWVASEAKRHRLKSQVYRNSGRVVKNQTARRIAMKRYRNHFPEKARAHRVLFKAVKNGFIKRLPCEVCGEKAEAHHDDYSKPLEVRWLCVMHHAQHHVAIREMALLK